MLTRDLAIVRYERGRVVPDLLRRETHARYPAFARRMLAVYRAGTGRARRDLHQEVERVFEGEADCDPRRVRAFCRLLDQESEFHTPARGEGAALRLAVFTRAAALGTEVATEELRATIASELGRPWPEVERDLYSDAPGLQPLVAFRGFADWQGQLAGPEALLSCYNVAQVQACLYQAERMTVVARDDFKTILRYAKLAGLLHEIRRLGAERYRFDLAGPASVLRATRRYGVRFACFLPALLACRGWLLEAVVRTPWGGRARLRISSRLGLRSRMPAPSEFDSGVEERFARAFGEVREGWRLLREAEVLWEGQTAFVPDFVFRHEGGREVLFEIVGFWTPRYLERKRETLAKFSSHRILVAVPRETVRRGWAPSRDTVVYTTAPRVEDVLEVLRRVVEEDGLDSPGGAGSA